MSISTSSRLLSDALLGAVRDLASARPHEPERAHFTPEQYIVYCRGYWMALCVVLQIVDRWIDHTAAREREDLERRRRAVARHLRRMLARPALRVVAVGRCGAA